MTDESDQTYPFTPNTLLDNALGPLGYYGAFTANMHTDSATTFQDTQLLASAQSRNVPVIAARQLLTWLDGRNGSSFGDLAWSNGVMSFSVSVGVGGLAAHRDAADHRARRARARRDHPAAAPPSPSPARRSRGRSTPCSRRPAAHTGDVRRPPATLALSAAATPTLTQDAATMTWSTGDASTSTVQLGTSATDLQAQTSVADPHHPPPGRPHRAQACDQLLLSADLRAGRRQAAHLARVGPAPATFRTPGVDGVRPAVTAVKAFSLPDGTAQVSWVTDEPSTSRVAFGRSATQLTSSRVDDALTRRHTVVLTGLPADADL